MIKYEVINIPLKRMNGLIFPGFSSQRLVPSQGRSPLWRFLASGLSSNNYLDLDPDYLLMIAHLSQLRFSVMGFRWLGIYIWLFTFRVLTLNVIFVWHWFKWFAVGHNWTWVQWAVCLHHKHCWSAQAGGWNFFGILTMIVTPLPSSLKILQSQIARLIFRVLLWRCGTRTSWSKTTT